MRHRRHPVALAARIAGVLALVAGSLLVAGPAYAATFPIDEPFGGSNTENPNWKLIRGNADIDLPHLTDEGDGWLRLTDANTFQSGSAVLDDPFPTSLGLVAEFDYATYGGIDLGGNRGDGFSFFFLDGSFPAAVGISGGGLGYTQVPGGYLGIGFDEFGNFSGDLGGPGQRPNHIVLRGSYNATPNWGYLTGVLAPGGTVETGSRAGVRHVAIVLTPQGSSATVSVFSNTGPDTPLEPVIENFDISAATGQAPLPPTFKLGISGSTGGATNYHEIRNLTVKAPTDLSIVKTGPATAQPGDRISWTLDVANSGVNAISAATVTDTVPAGVTDVSWTCGPGTGGATCPEPTGTGNDLDVPVNLPSGAAATITVTGTVGGTLSGTTLSNTATITAPEEYTDIDPTNNTSTTTTDVAESVDLSMTKVGPATANPQAEVGYTLTAANAGDRGVVGARVQDTVPAGLTDVTWTCTATGGASCAAPTGSGNAIDSLVDLPPGGQTVFDVTGTATDAAAGTTLTNTATIEPPDGVTDVDPDNNSDTVETDIAPFVDLAMTKTGPPVADPGQDVTYSLVATNNGNVDVAGATISDTLPAGLSAISWTCTATGGGSCADASGTGSPVEAVVDLPQGAAATVLVQATVTDAAAASVLTNAATITGPDGTVERTPLDNTDTVSTAVRPLVDVGIEKSLDTADPIEFGSEVGYTLTVTNQHPDGSVSGLGTATNVVVVDTLPAVLDPATVVAPGCTAVAATLTCRIGALAPGATVTRTVTGRASTSEAVCISGPAVQLAGVSSDGVDRNPDNDQARVSTPCVVPADLALTKTGPATAVTGAQVSWTVTATNNGNVSAPDAMLSDDVPAGISDVRWTCIVSDGSACSPASGADAAVRATATIPAGGSAVVTITGTADTVGPVTNTATITACQLCPETDTSDNTASVTVDIQAPVTPTTTSATTTSATTTSATSTDTTPPTDTTPATATTTAGGPTVTTVTSTSVVPTDTSTTTPPAGGPGDGGGLPVTGVPAASMAWWALGLILAGALLWLGGRRRQH